MNISLSALFIGAHPDDIEIGCGGTVAKLIHQGWQVSLCILTRDQLPMIAKKRLNETIKAATRLGVTAEHIMFLNMADSNLICTGKNVSAMRELMRQHHCNPDLIFTHTLCDSHGDHRAAHEITLSTFRKKPILCFGVVNSLISSRFKPEIFIDITEYFQMRNEALKAHTTQQKRIDMIAIEQLDQTYSTGMTSTKVEAFELVIQKGAEDLAYIAVSLNNNPFHSFWYPLIKDQGITNIYSVPVHRKHKQYSWKQNREREGLNILSKAFSKLWYNGQPITELSSDDDLVGAALSTSNLLLTGSAASNEVVEKYLNPISILKYITSYSSPDYQICIRDKINDYTIAAQYGNDSGTGITLIKDYGILTVIPNPYLSGRSLIACSGIHGFGTLACLKVIAEPFYMAGIPALQSFQILVQYEVKTGHIKLIPDSLYIIN